MSKLLSINSVSKSFFTRDKEISVLKNISLDIYENQIVAILGPSGCGKSTILNIISSLEKVTNGSITINAKLGYMFQKDALLPWKNIFNNICIGLEINKSLNESNINYANDLIKKYKLEEFKSSYPNQLSGGMRQRVALIRTLILNPELLLLDEPFSALDAQTKILVQNDVYNIIKQEKKSAIIVTHDISEAIALADKIVILTERPASIKNAIDIKMNHLSPLERRTNRLFSHYYDLITKELSFSESIL